MPNNGSVRRRLKLDKIFNVLFNRSLCQVMSMLPWERFPYIRHTSLEFVLLSHRGLGFLSLWELSTWYYLKHFILLHLYNKKKSQKHLHLSLFHWSFLLTNTFSSSWVRQPFLIWKVLQLISCTWESSRYFSGDVVGERSAIGKKFGKETWNLNYICCFIS